MVKPKERLLIFLYRNEYTRANA